MISLVDQVFELGLEIPVLFERFLAGYAALLERPSPRVGSDDLEALLAHSWPGNIQELQKWRLS